uniref:Uncharacterized protein n=1 Tax=Schistosoma japonicum TaxID=6182 RepID=Q5DG34_SCHJA|nr:unknown [Schistosoma japonicum]
MFFLKLFFFDYYYCCYYTIKTRKTLSSCIFLLWDLIIYALDLIRESNTVTSISYQSNRISIQFWDYNFDKFSMNIKRLNLDQFATNKNNKLKTNLLKIT